MVKQSSQITDNEELIQMALRTAKSGQKQNARLMFEQVWKRDKRNERAMLGLAQVARSSQEREKWLRRVLKVNPDNQTAKKALTKLQYSTTARTNRMLFLWGTVAVILTIVVIAVIFIVLSS